MKPILQKASLSFFFLFFIQAARACITCNQQVQEAIFDSLFYANLLSILSPFIVLSVLVAVLSAMATRRYKRWVALHPGEKRTSYIPLTAAATILGIGMGGFVDGIVLHQVLQWHEMLSNRLPPVTLEAKTVNMFWDGIFHAFTFLVTLTGIIMLWQLLYKRDLQVSGWLLSGGLLMGWALFNIVEGLANHHILKLHNVKELSTSVNAWNFGFLVFSIILGGVAAAFIYKGSRYQNSFNSAA